MIPFLDLRAQYAEIGRELEEAALAVLRSGQYILGPEVLAFEREFAAYCGCQHAVALNSGTSALQMAFLAAGVGPGDEVITTPATFVATVAAVQYVGATARLVDIDPATWTMDPGKLEAAITPRTKAIVPVHLHGRLADMPRIAAIAREYGITLIEDAAQAHGAELHGVRAGGFGDVGCFSFYPGKNLGACGEGGALVTNDAELAQRVRVLRDWGQHSKYLHVIKGFNFRMDSLQAALLRVKLRHLDKWTDARRKVAARYDARLADAGMAGALPATPVSLEHVYHVYAVRVADRLEVQQRLTDAGIQTNIHYPVPVHLQRAYSDLGYVQGDFPVAEALADETLSLPLFPEMRAAQVDAVCDALIAVVNQREVAHAGN